MSMYIMFNDGNNEVKLHPATNSMATGVPVDVSKASEVVNFLEKYKPTLIRTNVYGAILFIKSKLGCWDAVVDVDLRDVAPEQLIKLGERRDLVGARARALLDLSRGRSLVDVIVDHDVTLKSALNAGTYVDRALRRVTVSDNLTLAIVKLFNSNPPNGATRWTSKTLHAALVDMNAIDPATPVARVQRLAAEVPNYDPAAAFHAALLTAYGSLDATQRTPDNLVEYARSHGFNTTRAMIKYDARLLGLSLSTPTLGHELLADHVRSIIANGKLPVSRIIEELANMGINTTKFMVNDVLNRYKLAGRGQVVRYDDRGPKPKHNVRLTNEQIDVCERLAWEGSTPTVKAKRARILLALNDEHGARPTARYVAMCTETSIGTVCNVIRDLAERGFEFALSRERRGRRKNTNSCDNI